MSSTIHSAATLGYDVRCIDVEVDLSRGLPQFHIGGLGDTAIHESKERIRSAIKNSGFVFHDGRITVNLAPASLQKRGAALDCAIAVGILREKHVVPNPPEGWLILGELALSGAVRPVVGAINVALLARDVGVTTMVIPEQNLAEVRVVEGVAYLPVRNFSDIVRVLKNPSSAEVVPGSRSYLADRAPEATDTVAFDDISGHAQAKRALMIAAAGKHHVLMFGPPGAGKSLLASSIRALLPEMSEEEMIDTTRVYSAAGELTPERPLILTRPFRAPHHTSSAVSVLGGGTPPRPGEISLAHNGVLFLDEVLEFPRLVLEGLRQPLEAHEITINRSLYRSTFPADVLLIGAFNPCPCGYASDPERDCVCSSYQRITYAKRLSGPLRDRCDLFVHVERPDLSAPDASAPSLASAREQVNAAHARQQQRFSRTAFKANATMPLPFITNELPMADDARACALTAARRLHLSPRAYLKVVRTAQTIADLDQETKLFKSHVLEALQFRATDIM